MVARSSLPPRFGRLIKWSCSFSWECHAHFLDLLLHDYLQWHPSSTDPEGEIPMESGWRCYIYYKRWVDGGSPRGPKRA